MPQVRRLGPPRSNFFPNFREVDRAINDRVRENRHAMVEGKDQSRVPFGLRPTPTDLAMAAAMMAEEQNARK